MTKSLKLSPKLTMYDGWCWFSGECRVPLPMFPYLIDSVPVDA